ncbi:uncharacterized protein MONOS_5955 [Monocercomonoides exilis]|uniref:uncharacterized protein n=1 Tax=Monocercomonoides exilis TaxID=2049356 RepID=UPI00355A1440|nr:hypothetical protein MONOS_5955 [Monocercomonoides exilis]|eukprot:MONOS_5955.1-p1 / transcript=MONOS_5955.1 / gene=MONOS_5955 / organism=Monocercomonoides_exilis_PA203 / gene_product=unspecified product / transcript_product=unspecified product / location=Mono_scaffold00180:51640-52733(-) / protein_length=274 / sequence_SO=supercontig / SO=protein_coding / is_pseudo=false
MFEKMIIDEEKKKEEKNEKLLTDLCECYLALLERKHFVPDDVLKIVVHYILRAASNKEESEEVQKEVEMALLPLSNIFPYTVEKEEHEKELIEILLHHRQHHNLTHLAYQSALILLKGCMTGRNLRQKKYELEAANDNCRELHLKVMDLFQTMAISTIVSIDDMLKGGAIDCILEYMTKSTLDDEFVDSHVKTFLYIWERMIAGSFFLEKNNILCLLSSLSYKSKEIMNKGNDLAKRKIPFREMLEKLEEEGLEDIFIGFYGMNRIKDPDGDF